MPNSKLVPALLMLGYALSSSFKKGLESHDTDFFEESRKFIHSQVEAQLKIKLFSLNALGTIISLLLIYFISFLYLDIRLFLIGSACGILGSFISTIQRNDDITIEPYTSELGLFSSSLSRLITGGVFGIFVMLLAYSELALAPFKNNDYALICFSFIAGFSERFIPDIVSRIEKNSKNSEK